MITSGFRAGNYTLEAPIGEGGMACVWRARHTRLGIRAAVKFLLPQFQHDRHMQTRFLAEAVRQSKLKHAHIVPVLDFFEQDGISFLVMEYIGGGSLEQRLQQQHGPLVPEEIARLAEGVLAALEYAHQQAIVHRDIKPSNIVLGENGHPYLMDFGIAKALNERPLTLPGTILGTLDYLSPEQILTPSNVDARTDIYSMGCLLYEMATGHTPFGHIAGSGHGTDFAIKEAHVHSAPPPPATYNPAVSPAVEQCLMRCLAKPAGARFQSCAALAQALLPALRPQAIPPPLPSQSSALPPPLPSRPASFLSNRYVAGALSLGSVLLLFGLIAMPGRQRTYPTSPPVSTDSPVDRTPVEPNEPNRRDASEPAAQDARSSAAGRTDALPPRPVRESPPRSLPPSPARDPVEVEHTSAPVTVLPNFGKVEADDYRPAAQQESSGRPDEGVSNYVRDVARTGTLLWQGTLHAGETLTLAANASSAGTLSGSWPPGRPVRLTLITPGCRLLESPSAANHYNRIQIQCPSTAPQPAALTLRWDLEP